MGISITRVVKFIRKGVRGSSVIVADTSTRTFPLSMWQQLGSSTYQYSWPSIKNAADYMVGDTIVVNGVVADKGGISVSYYGTVLAVDAANLIVKAVGNTIILSGMNGSSFMAQYSIDGETNWHTTFTDGDIYMRTSADSGKTWSNAIRIVGEKGGETNYAFAWSSHATLDDSEDPLSDVVDWEDYPPKQPDGKPYLWTMITTPDGKVSYARLTGEKGDKGDKGDQGNPGASGSDAITIDISPTVILHKKAATNTTYSITIKVFEGTKQLQSSNGSGSSFKCSVDTSNFPIGLTWSTVTATSYFMLNLNVAANATPSKEITISIVCKGITHTRNVSFKTVADGDKGDKGDKGDPGQDGAKGERGAVMRGPQAWSDCAVGYNFQSGADGEEFKDVVMYGNSYYSCIKSHTKTESNNPTSTIDTNNGYWKSADKVEIIATKILLAQYALVKNLGVEAIDMKDSAGNIIFQAKDGNVICNSGTFKNGTFQNVKIIGSLRNPFTYAGSSMDTNYNDNVAMISYGGGWMTSYSLPWDVSQNGRKLSIVNYRWGSETAEGQAAISAPSGKYFFEDGLQKSQLRISREIIELIGYGTSTEFYGWIVVNRIDLMPTQRYGHCLKVLAYGTCAGSDTTAKTSLVYTTFDGSKLSVTRQSTGIYRITYPSTWFNGTSSNCRVIPTGRGNILNGSNPIKANLHSIGTNYFEVSVSDDSSRNDGSFDFIVYNGSDFEIL